jgi:hypothetical protein
LQDSEQLPERPRTQAVRCDLQHSAQFCAFPLENATIYNALYIQCRYSNKAKEEKMKKHVASTDEDGTQYFSRKL